MDHSERFHKVQNLVDAHRLVAFQQILDARGVSRAALQRHLDYLRTRCKPRKIMKQKRILVPTSGLTDWQKLLAEPEKHWQPGFSAMSTACSWEVPSDLPREIQTVFKRADDTALHDAELALAIPEYKVALAGGRRPSQNDVFALLSCSGGLISMMVEGKAREHFDATLGEWKKRTSPGGATARLADIQAHIGLAGNIPDAIRYQLLHRAASAVLEAKRFHAKYAVLLIQSFEKDDSLNHYEDYCAFVKLFRAIPAKGSLIKLSSPLRKPLYTAWVQSAHAAV